MYFFHIGRISIWKPSNKDPDQPYICTRVLKGHKHGVTGITQLPDGKLVSASYDRTVKMWDIFAPKTTTRTIVIHNNAGNFIFKLLVLYCRNFVIVTDLFDQPIVRSF